MHPPIRTSRHPHPPSCLSLLGRTPRLTRLAGLLGFLSLLLIGLLLPGCKAGLTPAPPPKTMHEHSFVTPDGWVLGALHFLPVGKPRPGQAPVILCHGTACNTRNMDLLERNSLARALARAGFDVWAVELRGGPLGSRRDSGGRMHLGHFQSSREARVDWDFDTHVELDVPTLVREVEQRSGVKGVHWVGHSLGGMVAWAAEVRGTIQGFRSIVGIGSPGAYGHPIPLAGKVAGFSGLLSLTNGAPIRAIMRGSSHTLKLMPPFVAHTLMNPENTDLEELRLMSRSMLEDSPRGLLAQYVRWIRSGEVVSRDGSYSYSQHLGSLRSPLAALSGRADGIAPPWTVLPLYARAGSADRTFKVFGVSEGDRIDYGHLDLVLGKHAPDEVYPWIASFLAEH